MDQTPLVGPDIEGGRRLLDRLEFAGMPIAAALWQQDEIDKDLGRWRFVLATPQVDSKGLKATFRQIDTALSVLQPPARFDVMSVFPSTPESWFMKGLRREFRNQRNVVIGKRPIGNDVIERGYIYFVK